MHRDGGGGGGKGAEGGSGSGSAGGEEARGDEGAQNTVGTRVLSTCLVNRGVGVH